MPFKKGRAPVRRTREYLESGQLIFKKNIRVMTVNFNTGQKASNGAYKFVFWHLPQIQYKNPNVQIVTFKNMTPSPFLQFFLSDGQRVLIEADSKGKEELYEHIKRVFCKSDEQLEAEVMTKQKMENPANFGYNFPRWCICEVPGQVPCSSWVEMPAEKLGKNTWQLRKQQEKENK